MKEYQQKRMKEFVMPETVYRQALWAAKDLPRMKKRIEEMTEKINAISIQTVRESRATALTVTGRATWPRSLPA